jgi:sterol desaturase/sphingolipid hydroxylase (fatty acid hydroxylase superfamily)
MKSNEQLATEIQKEWLFNIKRIPERILVRYNVVIVILVFLEILLVVSNNFYPLGYWQAFTHHSTQYRDSFRGTKFARVTRLDSDSLGPYSLWRGWVVPSFLAGSAYICFGILSLRYELYQWKPELLQYYLDIAKKSKFGRWIPQNWLDFAFHIYNQKHRDTVSRRIQERKHIALQDSKEFVKMLRVVGTNILISVAGLFVLWVLLLQTNVNADNIVGLPKSYVPPIQGIVWYFFNDCFYFYPHWIAHTGLSPDGPIRWILPPSYSKAIYLHFNQSHKLHHRTKANLGIAAWYCSEWEQILFNLFPAFIGPLVTQILADAAGVQDIWGTHLVTLYVWLFAAAANSVLAHTGYRSVFNDPGKHDLHHERAFNPKTAVNFGTMGFFDWLHGTSSSIPKADADAWRAQRDRQAALNEASRRTGIALTTEQMEVVKQPHHDEEWVNRKSI